MFAARLRQGQTRPRTVTEVDVDLRKLSVSELLKLLGELPFELMRRGLIRSARKNPTGELAERYVAQSLGTQPITGRDTGFDVVEPRTESRLQVKGSRLLTETTPAGQQWGDIEFLESDRFDEFVGVVLDRHYRVRYAWRMPRQTVQNLARTVRGKARLYVRDVQRAQANGDASIQDMELPATLD